MFAHAKDLMNLAVVTTPNATLAEVAGTMETLRISALPVVDPKSRVVGVISKSDLLHFSLHKEGDWNSYTVEGAMSPAVICCAPSARLPEVAALMKENRVHHIIVIGDSEEIGIISALDLAEPILAAFELLQNIRVR